MPYRRTSEPLRQAIYQSHQRGIGIPVSILAASEGSRPYWQGNFMDWKKQNERMSAIDDLLGVDGESGLLKDIGKIIKARLKGQRWISMPERNQPAANAKTGGEGGIRRQNCRIMKLLTVNKLRQILKPRK